MTQNTTIEWADHTWTPIVGCDAVSPACAKCYAALMAARLEAMGQPKYAGLAVRNGNIGKWTGKVTFWEPDLIKPLEVKKPGRWFLTSMGDVAHDLVTDAQLAQIFGVMAVAGAYGPFSRGNVACGPHTFLVLTKRPQRLAALLPTMDFRLLAARAAFKWGWNRTDAGWVSNGIHPHSRFWPLPNVFIGCTAEDQQRADELRPHMAALAAAGWKTFVSYEPALGPVDWKGWEFLRQLISGGESGYKARPSHPDWHRGARDWCAAAGVPYLFKQWGEWAPWGQQPDAVRGPFKHDTAHYQRLDDETSIERIGKKAAGRLLDGVEHNGFPEVAR